MASPRGQNQKGSQMQKKTNFDDVVGDGGGSELEYLKISLSLRALSGRQQRLIHKGRWEDGGSHKDSRRPMSGWQDSRLGPSFSLSLGLASIEDWR